MNFKYLSMILVAIALSGCASKTLYHWGNYSDTLYASIKEPTAESRAKHKAELSNIIAKAEQKKKKVPPGIYFELATLEANDGNKEKAKEYFSKEISLFPESKKYVELALKEMES